MINPEQTDTDRAGSWVSRLLPGVWWSDTISVAVALGVSVRRSSV